MSDPITLIGALTGLVFALGYYQRCRAEVIWARRCDPNNPRFRQPWLSKNE